MNDMCWSVPSGDASCLQPIRTEGVCRAVTPDASLLSDCKFACKVLPSFPRVFCSNGSFLITRALEYHTNLRVCHDGEKTRTLLIHGRFYCCWKRNTKFKFIQLLGLRVLGSRGDCDSAVVPPSRSRPFDIGSGAGGSLSS